MNEIITGEKIQQLCIIYIGRPEDFQYNPLINRQQHKHVPIESINSDFENPKLVFCYSNRIEELSKKIQYFKNDFILVTHNSDYNIKEKPSVLNILTNKKLIKWYSQNICFNHFKLKILPIGLANSMWRHGNLSIFNEELVNSLSNKKYNIYFNFNIVTNVNKRIPCYEILKNKIKWLPTIDPYNNLHRLKEYKFSICPKGNGVDTHRLWESLYLRVVPIVLDSDFTQILIKNKVPLVVLNNWDDLIIENLNYDDYDFNNESFLNILYFSYISKDIIGSL